MRLILLAGGLAALAVLAVPMIDRKTDVIAEAEKPSSDRAAAYAPAREEIRRHRSGHYFTEASIEGRSVDVLVDTGASKIVLTHEDARRVGLSPARLDYSIVVSTANGEARAARVVLERVAIGSVMLRDVDALVARQGALSVTLLGMSFLGRLASFGVENDRLVLKQ